MDLRPLSVKLRQSSLLRASAVYAVAAWVAIQVAVTTFPLLGLPEWTVRAVLFLALALFPVVLVGVALAARGSAKRWPIIAVAIIVALSALLIPRATSRTGQLKAVDQAIAVFPFRVTGATDTDDLGGSFAHLVATNLDGVLGMRKVDPTAIRGMLRRTPTPDDSTVLATARRLGAAHLVTGEIVLVGARMRVSAKLFTIDQNGDPVTATAEGTQDQILELVDQIARMLLANRSGFRNMTITASTTHSLAAMRAYLDGEAAMRRVDFPPAVAAYKRAVAADSTFALAHYRLAMAEIWEGNSEGARQALARAAVFANRLAERERALLDGLNAFLEGDAHTAEARYTAIVRSYPTDVEAWYMLGETHFHFNWLRGRSPQEARASFERTLIYQPDDEGSSLIHLAILALVDGRTEETVRLAKRHLEAVDSIGDYVWMTRAMIATASGDARVMENFRRELRQAAPQGLGAVFPIFGASFRNRGFDPDLVEGYATIANDVERPHEIRAHRVQARAAASAARGDFAKADSILLNDGSFDPPLSISHRAYLAAFPWRSITRPQLERIQNELAAWDVSRIPPRATAFFLPQNTSYPAIRQYLLGLVAIQLGDDSKLQLAIEELDRMKGPDEIPHLPRNYVHALRAHRAWRRGDAADALRELERMDWRVRYELKFNSPFYNWPRERLLRAQALDQLGRRQEALGWYDSFRMNSMLDVMFQPQLPQPRTR